MTTKPKCMNSTDQVTDLGQRWAWLLREQTYPGSHKAKRIAADWDISVSLAKVWLAGGKPTSDQIARAHSMWGDAVLHILFGRQPLRTLAERLSAVEHQIAAIKSGASEVSGGQNLRLVDETIPRLASGGERASSAVVGPDVSALGRRLWVAQLAEQRRRARFG